MSKLLLSEGAVVHGYDSMNSYYDVALIKAREKCFLPTARIHTTAELEDQEKAIGIVNEFKPDIIIHLAAQAGVRYSRDNPQGYVNSNLVGTFRVMEAVRASGVRHMMMATTSSV